MTLRNTSGKFSLPSFGRKVSGVADSPTSPSRVNGTAWGNEDSPARDSIGSAGGSGGGGGGGFGTKLGKSIAHQSLLPSLGNQDLRALQDIISTEKGVLTSTERLAQDTSKAAHALPPYGSSEGPDLQDVLTQSAQILGQLSNALSVYTNHSTSIRGCFKRIREREEKLDDLKRRRKNTGSKAEAAEKKLAKMGPENKGLPQQTELLERLRVEMRQMDSDIVVDESKVGDFKRQMIKEALSYKFGGLEELGEKMCIIGELGKLLIEEIPLEETPPGYGRAPYTGYDKTENAVNEANKCLSTVKFSAGSVGPKPPGLPPHDPIGSLGGNSPDPSRLAAAEEFGHLPPQPHPTNTQQPQQYAPVDFKGKGREYGLDDTNLYGGGFDNPYDRAEGRYPTYDDRGHQRNSSGSMPGQQQQQQPWQGPTEEALRAHTQATEGQRGQHPDFNYEYEQQKQMDAEAAAWRNEGQQAGAGGGPQIPAVPTVQVPTPDPEQVNDHQGQEPPQLSNPLNDQVPQGSLPPGAAAATSGPDHHLQRPWQPLNVRDRSRSPAPVSLSDGPPRLPSPERSPRPLSQDPLSGIGAMMTSTDIDEGHGHGNDPDRSRDSVVPPPPAKDSYGGYEETDNRNSYEAQSGVGGSGPRRSHDNDDGYGYGGQPGSAGLGPNGAGAGSGARDGPLFIPPPPPPPPESAGFYTPTAGTPENNEEYFQAPRIPGIPGRLPSPAPVPPQSPRQGTGHAQLNFPPPPPVSIAVPPGPASTSGPGPSGLRTASGSSYTPTSGGGKISAAAFKRKPRASEGTQDSYGGGAGQPLSPGAPQSPFNPNPQPPNILGQMNRPQSPGGVSNAGGGRRLPMPPGPHPGQVIPPVQGQYLPAIYPSSSSGQPQPGMSGQMDQEAHGQAQGQNPAPVRPETPIEANFALPASPTMSARNSYQTANTNMDTSPVRLPQGSGHPNPSQSQSLGMGGGLGQGNGASGSFADIEPGEASPPPMYGHEDSMR